MQRHVRAMPQLLQHCRKHCKVWRLYACTAHAPHVRALCISTRVLDIVSEQLPRQNSLVSMTAEWYSAAILFNDSQ